MADPQAPRQFIRARPVSATSAVTLGRAAHFRLATQQYGHVRGRHRPHHAAIDISFEPRQDTLQALRGVSLGLLRGAAPPRSDSRYDALRSAEPLFTELGARLSGLVGRDGFRALLARALHIAAADFPILFGVTPASSPLGRLTGFRGRHWRNTPASEVRGAVAATLAALLWLLHEFIGPDLTQRILADVCPWFGDSVAPPPPGI